mgnify:CR=1 FL=1
MSSEELIHPVFHSKKGLAATGVKALGSRNDGSRSGLTLSDVTVRDERDTGETWRRRSRSLRTAAPRGVRKGGCG